MNHKLHDCIKTWLAADAEHQKCRDDISSLRKREDELFDKLRAAANDLYDAAGGACALDLGGDEGLSVHMGSIVRVDRIKVLDAKGVRDGKTNQADASCP